MKKPTVGMAVWYWPGVTDADNAIARGGDQPLPATITHVWGDTSINIGGFDANGTPFQRSSLTLYDEAGQLPRPSSHFAEYAPILDPVYTQQGGSDITADPTVRLFLETGLLVKVNGISVQLDHDVVVRVLPENVPLLFAPSTGEASAQ